MNIRLLINDVGNGDAIFFALEKRDNILTGIIDGGRENDANKLIHNLQLFLNSYGKSYPDVVIGTHFDNDHIAGILPILNFFSNPKISLFLFDTSNYLDEQQENETSIFLPSEDDDVLGSESQDILGNIILRSLQKEKEILAYAKSQGMKITEPIAGVKIHEDWPEITILGPTMEYYKKLFPDKMGIELIKEEYLRSINTELISEAQNPCIGFNLTKSPVSRINLLSAIIKIETDNKLLLFTGDAGIDSFYNIPDYKKELSNIDWLKMPHHGSANNINLDLLDLMNPKNIAISSGSYVNQRLVECLLTKGVSVKTTQNGSFEFIL